eukprot:8773888-Pyramimonas_sp.AAC.1
MVRQDPVLDARARRGCHRDDVRDAAAQPSRGRSARGSSPRGGRAAPARAGAAGKADTDEVPARSKRAPPLPSQGGDRQARARPLASARLARQ